MNDHIVIRFALPSERAALEALQWRASLANEADREALLAHPDAISLPVEQLEFQNVFVAERDGAVAGFAAVVPRGDGDAELDGLFVEPAHWRTGIGRALVARSIEHARGFGAGALYVIGNNAARGFYEACGFEVTGTCETRFGPALTMRRAL